MDSPEKGKVSYFGTIPAAYAPCESANLFSRKWWEEVSTKDAFWKDFDDKVPEDIVNKRLKQNFEVVLDIERNARKREEKRREREAKRSQVGPKITDKSPVSPHSRITSAESTITVLHAASIPLEAVPRSDNVQKDSSQVNVVEKIECPKCGDFYMQAEMESGSGEASVCGKCAKVKTSEETKIPLPKSTKGEESAEHPVHATAASSTTKTEASEATAHDASVIP